MLKQNPNAVTNLEPGSSFLRKPHSTYSAIGAGGCKQTFCC